VRQGGDPDGQAVFFFHGLGASRCCLHPDDHIAAELGVRLLAIDRPGIGHSDRQPGATALDGANDVEQLADALGIARFSLFGWSAGAVHALACARQLGDRVRAVALASPLARLAGDAADAYVTDTWRRLERTARIAPWLLRAYVASQCRALRRAPSRFLARLTEALPPPDRAVLANRPVRDAVRESFTELVRQGSRGAFDDALAAARPWGFDPAHVRAPVMLWHGRRDALVPPIFGEYLARQLPACEARFMREDGHLIYLARWREILTALTKSGPP
jgi:pimeloyl-ACP methyl ester carboxylesterase